MKKRSCLLTAVTFLLIFPTLAYPINGDEGKMTANTCIAAGTHEGIFLVVGTFDEMHIDNRGYCSNYVFNNTSGIIVGMQLTFKEESGKIDEIYPVRISMKEVVLSFPTFDSFGSKQDSIKNNYFRAILQEFNISSK